MNKKIVTISRILLGVVFVFVGGAELIHIITGTPILPQPIPTPKLELVNAGFKATVYLVPLVKVIEVVAGIMLLANKRTVLAITMLIPIIINIVGFHLFVEMSGLPIAIILVVLTAILIKDRWNYFKPIFTN